MFLSLWVMFLPVFGSSSDVNGHLYEQKVGFESTLEETVSNVR